jgi:N-acetyl sugar amidotransferase
MTASVAQRCTRCILDTKADPRIRFDAEGICNHCRRYESLREARIATGERGRVLREQLVERMRREGKGREYDCIIGVSGGVDSTYVASLVKSYGLRPLAVHLDNGWNSELAVANIERVLRRLNIDLHTHVIDWEEFRDLQVSFLRASTPDGEIPSDHAIFALLWRTAAKFGVRTIVSGMNYHTEAYDIPDWSYGHSDWTYVKDVHRRFGRVPLRTYPHFSLPYLLWLNGVRRIRTVSILNYIEYDKRTVMRHLEQELGWTNYGGKHHESIYTRFYQGYVLPRKFGIDKRQGHLSDLINSGQMDREAALAEMAQPPYDPALQEQDREYVIRKLELSAREFDEIMVAPPRSFRDFRNNFSMVQRLRRTVNWLRNSGWYPR